MSRGNTVRVQAGLILGLLLAFGTQVPVGAAQQTTTTDPESILLSPSSKRYELDAGTSKTDSFKIVNDGTEKFSFVVYARPYSVKTGDETYEPNFSPSDAKNADAYKWIQFAQPSYQVEPGKSVDVRYTIRVPQGATPGGHYGVLFAETQPQNNAETTSVVRKKRIGSILYTTVKGDVTLSGSVLNTNVPLFQFLPPLQAGQRVKNSGNTDFTVKTKAVVSTIFGQKKYEAEQEAVVLPDTIRDIRNDWKGAAWIGFYKVEFSSSFLDTKMSSTHYVLLVPLWLYLTLFILIGLRVAYAVSLRRKR